MDDIIDQLKIIYEFFLATISGLIMFTIIFSGIIGLGLIIFYLKGLFPDLEFAWAMADYIDHYLIVLETILLFVYYTIHFIVTFRSLIKYYRNGR